MTKFIVYVGARFSTLVEADTAEEARQRAFSELDGQEFGADFISPDDLITFYLDSPDDLTVEEEEEW